MAARILDFTVDASVDASIVDELCRRVPYCSERIVGCDRDADDPRRLIVRLDPAADPARVRMELDRLVAELRSARRLLPERVIAEERAVAGHVHDGIADDLVRRGYATDLGDGQVALSDALARLADHFEAHCVEFGVKAGATRMRVPSLIPVRVLARLDYIRNFPNHLTFVAHVRADAESVKHVAQLDPAHPGAVAAHLQTEHVLAPNVCFHVFHALEDRSVELDAGGGRAFFATARCFRHEAGRMRSLERLWEFSMSEVVYVGTPDYVLKSREEIMNASLQLTRALGLGGQLVVANDPFFTDDFHQKADFQIMNQLKYELRLPISSKGDTLAVASFNYHMDHFGQRLGITRAGTDGSVSSGCAGWGLERLAYAFVARHGADPLAWPAAVRDQVTG